MLYIVSMGARRAMYPQYFTDMLPCTSILNYYLHLEKNRNADSIQVIALPFVANKINTTTRY